MGNGGIIIAVILLVVAVGLSLVFALVSLFSNLQESKKTLISIVGLAVVVIIGFALAGGELPQFAIDRGISASQYKMIGGVINIALIASVVTVILIIGDFILGLTRRN
jgi:hypothetical protein